MTPPLMLFRVVSFPYDEKDVSEEQPRVLVRLNRSGLCTNAKLGRSLADPAPAASDS